MWHLVLNSSNPNSVGKKNWSNQKVELKFSTFKLSFVWSLEHCGVKGLFISPFLKVKNALPWCVCVSLLVFIHDSFWSCCIILFKKLLHWSVHIKHQSWSAVYKRNIEKLILVLWKEHHHHPLEWIHRTQSCAPDARTQTRTHANTHALLSKEKNVTVNVTLHSIN